MNAILVTSVKNEAAFLIEWLAHHRKVGFDHFLVFSNDCTDGTDLMLDRLEERGWLTHLRNEDPKDKGPQWAALNVASKHPLVRGADWVLFADVDEFVNIHCGDGTLSALTCALPQADAITLTWRMFGNGGVIGFEDRPVTETFTRAAPATLAWPWRAQMFKTLYRPSSHAKMGVHRPRGPDPAAAPRWFDGSGRDVTRELSGNRLFSDYRRDNYGLVQLNHYALGSMENFLVKSDRGRANREADAFDLGYWIERNLCEAQDTSILSRDSSDLRRALLGDADLSALHRAGVDWRHKRFAQLMQDEKWRGMFGRLLMIPPSRSLGPEVAALIQRHKTP